MKKDNQTKVTTARPEELHATEAHPDNVPARQAFMGHDFLRRNLLALLPPVIQLVTRPVN